MSSGWVQVHISGLPPSVQLETLEETTLGTLLMKENSDVNTMWAGPGTTVLKESRDGNSSYAFAAFYTMEGALAAVELINNSNNTHGTPQMRAELSKPKKKTQHNATSQTAGSGAASHVRLRRKRAPPAPKHPVVTSSAPPRKNKG